MVASALDHEQKHVATDRAIIERYAPIFRQRVGIMVEAVGTEGPEPEAELGKLRKRIEEKIDAAIAITTEAMTVERNEKQHAIDSLEEYERLRAICPQVNVDRPGADSMRS
jgi:hypothetical protein